MLYNAVARTSHLMGVIPRISDLSDGLARFLGWEPMARLRCLALPYPSDALLQEMGLFSRSACCAK